MPVQLLRALTMYLWRRSIRGEQLLVMADSGISRRNAYLDPLRAGSARKRSGSTPALDALSRRRIGSGVLKSC